MCRIGKKIYFNIFSLVALSIIISLLLIGQIVFTLLALFYFIPNWSVGEILLVSFVAFDTQIIIFVLLILLLGLSYWEIDEDGVINGNALMKRKILFSSSDFYKVDVDLVPALIRTGGYNEECFQLISGKKKVLIPLSSLTKEELEWLKTKMKINNIQSI